MASEIDWTLVVGVVAVAGTVAVAVVVVVVGVDN